MDKHLALNIFTLGVRYGVRQKSLGCEPDKMSDDGLAEILFQGFTQYDAEIEKHAQGLMKQQAQGLWYAQNWTAKQSYRFGLLAGFETGVKSTVNKKGIHILTEETIDKLTQLQFRDCKEKDGDDN